MSLAKAEIHFAETESAVSRPSRAFRFSDMNFRPG